MNNNNIYLTLKNIITEYNKQFSINEDEINSLISLCKSRLMITVVMAKKQRIKYPSNQYLSISEKDAWSLLEKLDKIPINFLIYIVREICSFDIIHHHNEIINYINKFNFGNIFKFNLLDKNKSILKLSSDSPLLKGNPDNSSLKKRVNKIFKEDNSRIGIGLYNEKRKVYKGPNFISELNLSLIHI